MYLAFWIKSHVLSSTNCNMVVVAKCHKVLSEKSTHDNCKMLQSTKTKLRTRRLHNVAKHQDLIEHMQIAEWSKKPRPNWAYVDCIMEQRTKIKLSIRRLQNAANYQEKNEQMQIAECHNYQEQNEHMHIVECYKIPRAKCSKALAIVVLVPHPIT